MTFNPNFCAYIISIMLWLFFYYHFFLDHMILNLLKILPWIRLPNAHIFFSNLWDCIQQYHLKYSILDCLQNEILEIHATSICTYKIKFVVQTIKICLLHLQSLFWEIFLILSPELLFEILLLIYPFIHSLNK